MEFAPVSYARLRAGWDEGSFSFGGGISGLGLVLDYAWCGTDLVGTHRISLTKGLGRSVEEERRRTEERQEAAQQARAEQERQARIAQAMAEAQRLADSNDHIAALGAWHSVINLDPGNAAASQAIRDLTARIETATLAAAQEQRQSAILREHVKMALEHSAQARYREAINEWERVLELDPANEEASQNLQGSRAALEAEITRRRALARASERGEPVQAVLAWRSLLELRPDDSEGKTALERLERRVSEADHLKLGLEYYRAGDLRRAAAEFEIVLRANPNQEVARENLRRCFQKAGSPERPQNKEVWNLHLEGLSCYARGDYRGAIAAWERVLKIEPGNDSALRNIAEARRRLELGGRP
jgi:tetratricopeptide (TPR) repeat protein